MYKFNILKNTLLNLKTLVIEKNDSSKLLYNNYDNRRNSEECILWIDNTYDLYQMSESHNYKLLKYLLDYDNSFFNYKKELNDIYHDMKESFIGLCHLAEYVYSQEIEESLSLSLKDCETIFYHYLLTFLDNLSFGYYDYKINDLSDTGFSGKRKNRALKYLVNRVKRELKN
jgi:hypothetical protein